MGKASVSNEEEINFLKIYWVLISLDVSYFKQEKGDFTNISLAGDPEQPPKKKVPRRLIYCSDGVLEEYSTDEEEEKPPEPTVNPVRIVVHFTMQLFVKSTRSLHSKTRSERTHL